ncbi:MAG: hypothetical protein ACP5IC_00590 [Minisyncoccia bacterium]
MIQNIQKILSGIIIIALLANVIVSTIKYVYADATADVVAAKCGKDVLMDSVANLINQGISFVTNLLGIKPPEPVPTHDEVFSLKTCINTVLDWLQHHAWTVAKKQLLTRMTNQIIDYIKGTSGKPRFITDWQGFLKDSLTNALNIELSSAYPGLCTGFKQPLIDFTLKETKFKVPRPMCTLKDMGRNLQDAYSFIKSGGWITYHEKWSDSNNWIGALVQLEDTIFYTKAEATEKAENTANNGFLPVAACTQWMLVDLKNMEVVTTTNGPIDKDHPDAKPLSPDSQHTWLCAHEQVLTPSNTVADLTNKAVSNQVETVTNSDDIDVYINAILDALWNKALKTGIASIQNLFTPQNTPQNQPSDWDSVDCSLLGPEARAQCEQSQGAQGQNSQNNTIQNITTQLNGVISALNSALPLYNDLASSTNDVSLLELAKLQQCASSSQSSSIYQGYFNQLSGQLSNVSSSIQSTIQTINDNISVANRMLSSISASTPSTNDLISMQIAARSLSQFASSTISSVPNIRATIQRIASSTATYLQQCQGGTGINNP